MAQDWSRTINTTIRDYIRVEEPNIMRNRKLLALLQSRGRITFGHSGTAMDWKIRYKRAPMQGYAEGDVLTFSRKDKWKTAVLDWRGYAATDSMYKMERLKNKSTEAIIKVFDEIASSLLDDMDDQFGDQFYVDGNASGNSRKIHGIESFLGNSGAATNGYIATPSDTYAGIQTDLAAYGGSWSSTGGNSDWPTGTGDAHYDFFSPLIVDYTDTAWAAGNTWANNCLETLRYGIIKGKKNKSKKGMLDLILLNDELFRMFSNKFDASQRTNVEKGEGMGLYALGFTDTITFEGVDVSYEYGIPTGLGYGFPLEQMELCSLQDQLFVPTGPSEDISTQSFRFSIDFFGNLRWKSPRYAVKWMART